MDRTSGDRAVDALVAVGLREYEAKCFVALTQLSDATAKEVSELADVPRSRVYDSMESLTEVGLVETQRTKPIRYRSVSDGAAIDVLERDHRSRLDEARDSLSQLESLTDAGISDDFGVWTVDQADAITRRGSELIRGADEEVYIAAGRMRREAVLAWVEAAVDRGCAINGTLPTSLQSEVTDAVADDSLRATFVAAPKLDGISRLLVTDRGTALVAATPFDTGDGTDGDAERAVERELGLYSEPSGLGPIVSRLVTEYVSSLSGTAGFSFEPGSA